MKCILTSLIITICGLILLSFGSLLVIFVAYSISAPDAGIVFVHNGSSENLSVIMLKMDKKKYEITNLKKGGSKRIDFKIRGDGHYTITAFFENKKKLRKEIGYYTHGMNSVDVLIIKDDDIVLKSVEDLLKDSGMSLTTTQ